MLFGSAITGVGGQACLLNLEKEGQAMQFLSLHWASAESHLRNGSSRFQWHQDIWVLKQTNGKRRLCLQLNLPVRKRWQNRSKVVDQEERMRWFHQDFDFINWRRCLHLNWCIKLENCIRPSLDEKRGNRFNQSGWATWKDRRASHCRKPNSDREQRDKLQCV